MFKNDVGTCNGQLPLFCLFKLFPMFGNPPPWRGMDHVGKDLLSKADRLAPPAWQVEYSQVTRALPLSNPHVRCCARSQWRDRDGRDSSFFSHSRGSSSCKVGLLELAVHVAVATSEWSGGRVGAGETYPLLRGAYSPPAPLWSSSGASKRLPPPTLSKISIFSKLSFSFKQYPVLDIIFLDPFFNILSARGKYYISSVFWVIAPIFSSEKVLELEFTFTCIHTRIYLHKSWQSCKDIEQFLSLQKTRNIYLNTPTNSLGLGLRETSVLGMGTVLLKEVNFFFPPRKWRAVCLRF